MRKKTSETNDNELHVWLPFVLAMRSQKGKTEEKNNSRALTLSPILFTNWVFFYQIENEIYEIYFCVNRFIWCAVFIIYSSQIE